MPAHKTSGLNILMVEGQDKEYYDPAIDALRGVAVLFVVLCHLAHLLPLEWKSLFFAGGFIGVDIFFCTSGYLISKINLERCNNDSFHTRTFLAGRVFRLFPAAITMTMVVMGTSLLFMQLHWMSKTEVYEAAWAGISHMTFWSNFYFGNTLDYFSFGADTQPLLHTWSLSLEEQFYLCFAILLLPLAKLNRSFFCGILVLLALCSFLYNLFCFPEQNQMAYYSPFTRIWQILIGCLIAVLPSPKFTDSFAKTLGILGIAALFASAWGINRQIWYPSSNIELFQEDGLWETISRISFFQS